MSASSNVIPIDTGANATVLNGIIDAETNMYVTMRIEQQLFGIPVKNVRDVLRQQKITSIPLSAAEVAGSLNLRGRIVTVINLRRRLRLVEKEMDENLNHHSPLKLLLPAMKAEGVRCNKNHCDMEQQYSAHHSLRKAALPQAPFRSPPILMVDSQTLLKIEE